MKQHGRGGGWKWVWSGRGDGVGGGVFFFALAVGDRLGFDDDFCCTLRAARRFRVSGTCKVVRLVDGEQVGVAPVVRAGGVEGRVLSVSVTTIASLFSLIALIPRREEYDSLGSTGVWLGK